MMLHRLELFVAIQGIVWMVYGAFGFLPQMVIHKALARGSEISVCDDRAAFWRRIRQQLIQVFLMGFSSSV